MNNDINNNPANDYPIGRLGLDDADTEGHVRSRQLDDTETDLRAVLEDADTEGHIRAPHFDGTESDLRAVLEDADTEGHIRARD